MSQTAVFFDSRPNQSYAGTNLRALVRAVAQLNRDTREGKVEFVSFAGRSGVPSRDLPEIITPGFDASRVDDIHDAALLSFSVSHYVGRYSTRIDGEPVSIEIKPRWGVGWLAYLLRYTTGIYLPPDASAANTAQSHSAEWFLVLLWRSLFLQALRRFHLPREYRSQLINERFFRGRLDVAWHIRVNLTDESRFACVHRPLTPDTLINRTIRFVLKKLEATPHGKLVGDLHAHSERLAGFGVRRPDRVGLDELDRIRYSKMTEGYRLLMQASRAILRRFGSGAQGATENAPSFFVDMAELWENYLQSILTARLPEEYRVYSPNETGGEWLVAGDRRRIRPDIVIEKEGRPVAILDAKFKRYTQIGKHEAEGVSRDDLYQMTTYLYHYSQHCGTISGLFVCPGVGDGEVCLLAANPRHRIGVVNFGIAPESVSGNARVEDATAFDLGVVHFAEARFASLILDHLQGTIKNIAVDT